MGIDSAGCAQNGSCSLETGAAQNERRVQREKGGNATAKAFFPNPSITLVKGTGGNVKGRKS